MAFLFLGRYRVFGFLWTRLCRNGFYWVLPSFELSVFFGRFGSRFSWFLWVAPCRSEFYWVFTEFRIGIFGVFFLVFMAFPVSLWVLLGFLPSFELGSSYRVFLGFAVCGSRLLLGFYRVYGWGNVDAIPSLHSPLSVAMVTGGGSP